MRGRARNQLSDLRAIAAMPGIDRLADVMETHDPGSPTTDHLSLLLFTAARWRVGSGRELESLLAEPGVWEMVRLAAFGAGRRLSRTVPTYDMFHGFRSRLDALGRPAFMAMLDEFHQTFTEQAVAEARALGLLGQADPDWEDLQLGNTVAADGTLFGAASDVRVDEDGTVHGSRADDGNPNGRGPRIVHKRPLKKKTGVPVTAATVRGTGWNHRIVLAAEAVHDGQEVYSARRLLDRVIDVAGIESVHTVVYDRAFSGMDINRLLRAGVLPVVRMKEADGRTLGKLAITQKQAHSRYLDGQSRTKRTLRLGHTGHAVHDPHGCVHDLWGLDGSMTILPIDEQIDGDSTPSHAVDFIRVRDAGGGWQWHGVYRYDCGGHSHTATAMLLLATAVPWWRPESPAPA